MMTVSLVNRFGRYIMADSSGRELATEIRATLARGEDVSVDFAGVTSVITAFLNPAFGELYENADADEIDRRVTALGLSTVQEASLCAVREHARRYYGDPAYRRALDAALEATLAEF